MRGRLDCVKGKEIERLKMVKVTVFSPNFVFPWPHWTQPSPFFSLRTIFDEKSVFGSRPFAVKFET